MSENQKDHRMEDLVLYEENLLEPDERREVEEHLRGCAECQATLVKVKHYLPLLHEALKPNELPAEELLRRAKAEVRAKKDAPAPLFTRLRVALLGFGLATASAIFIVVQTLLRPLGPALVAKTGTDAGAPSGLVAAPRRPEKKDGGVDGGAGGEGK